MLEKTRLKLEGLYYLWFQKPYSLENAREYWSYPPCKAMGKQHTEFFSRKPDSYIKNLIEAEIQLRGEKQETTRAKISLLIKDRGIKKMLDFGCGLGAEGVYLAREVGLEVVSADISLSNIELTSRYAGIWDIPIRATYIANPETMNFHETFDLIYADGVFHHTPRPKPIVNNLLRFLRPGGLFFVMLYTRKHYEHTLARNLAHYAACSEGVVPAGLKNPHSTYYDLRGAMELFRSCQLMEKWTTNRGMFGWYCFERG